MYSLCIVAGLFGPAARGALSVEEWLYGRDQRRRQENLVVREVGQNREPILRHVLALPAGVLQAAAEQLVELNDVLGPVHVGVAVNQHDRHPQLLDVLGPVVGRAHELAHRVEELRELRRIRRDRDIRLIHRRALHLLRHRGADLRLHRQHLGIEAVLREAAETSEAANAVGMLNGQPEAGACAEG